MKLIDLTGQRFGKLVVIDRAESRGKQTMWNCLCDCGNKTVAFGGHLKDGHTKSCGCQRKNACGNNFRTHGMSDTHLYYIWYDMKVRCYYRQNNNYHNYGGRGITVCDEWLNSFEAFRDWALQNGYQDGLSIERIDVNGNYCPANCCFITMAKQALNKRDNHLVDYYGELLPISEAARRSGIDPHTISKRIQYGFSGELLFYKGNLRWSDLKNASTSELQ